jgi:hypothetical protein
MMNNRAAEGRNRGSSSRAIGKMGVLLLVGLGLGGCSGGQDTAELPRVEAASGLRSVRELADGAVLDRSGAQFSADRLLGQTVRDEAYNPVGTLTDVLVDEQDRAVLMMVAMDDQVSAAPWSAVFIQPQPLRIVVDAPTRQLRELAFDPAAGPVTSDYVSLVYTAYEDDRSPVYAFGIDIPPGFPQAVDEEVTDEDRTFWQSPLSAGDGELAPEPHAMVAGVITAIRQFRSGPTDISGSTEMLLRTDTERNWTVIIRSNDALRRQDSDLAVGDRVTVLGPRYRREKRDFIVAGRIVTDDAVLQFADVRRPPTDATGGPIRSPGPVDITPYDNPRIVPGSRNMPGGPIPQIPMIPEAGR